MKGKGGEGGGGGGAGGAGGSRLEVGDDGGWSMASIMQSAHGSSEFVTCCAGPGAAAGVNGGWVATGGTDWSVSKRG